MLEGSKGLMSRHDRDAFVVVAFFTPRLQFWQLVGGASDVLKRLILEGCRCRILGTT